MLTAAQIDAFKRDGVLALRSFFAPNDVSVWRAQIFDYFGQPENGDAWRDALATHKADDFRLAPEPAPDTHAALGKVYKDLHATAQWAGHNQLVVRAGDDPADWRGPRLAHIDIPLYAPIRTLTNNVTYLSEVRERGGGFIYWPGSHRIVWDYFRRFPEDYMARGARSHNQVFTRLVERMTSAPVEFLGQPGDLLIWHALTLHSASINKSSDVRLALFGRWGVLSDLPDRHDFSDGLWRAWQFKEAEGVERAPADVMP